MGAKTQRFILVHDQARERAKAAVGAAPDGYVCTVDEPKRNLLQNAKLHAMIGDISKQVVYLKARRSETFWKCLLVSGFEIATGRKPEIAPGLEGEFVNIRGSTSDMGIGEMAELIDYVDAYGNMSGVEWSEKARIEIPLYRRGR